MLLSFIRTTALCALVGVVAGTMTAAAPAFEWQTATPETHGLSSARLDSFRDHLSSHATKAFLLVHDDTIVYE